MSNISYFGKRFICENLKYKHIDIRCNRNANLNQYHNPWKDLRERTETMSSHGDRRGQIADFRDSFETIYWLYLLFKCGIKTKAHFEWLLWHWSSLGQLNLEPTRPNGLVGCQVPTDLVKISVKEATHMGFHYTPLHGWCNIHGW